MVTAPDGAFTLNPNDGTQKTYTLTINVASAPVFVGTIAAQIYTVGQPVLLSLPTAGGDFNSLTYSLSGTLPAGLTFSDDGTNRLLAGTPATVTVATALTYTATNAAGVADSLTFMVTVNAAPTFNISVIPLPDATYTYIPNRPFPTLTLPPAINGTGTLVYTLLPTASIPTGLNFDATERTLSGTPTVATTDAALTYAATDTNGVAVTAVFTLTGDFIPAMVTSVSGADGAYKEDGSVLITINFAEPVTVSGIPQLALSTGNSIDGAADYTSGTGTAALTFTYTVLDGDNTSDLAYTGTDALSLNGGTIRNTVGNRVADLTLPGVSAPASLSGSSAVVLDTTVPVFTSGDSSAVAVGSATTVVAYNANAKDNGLDAEVADTGITYTLGGTDALTFEIDADSGEVRYNDIQADEVIHNIVITATDLAGNTATQEVTISVLNAPVVSITDSVTSEYINAAVTFTFTFSEMVDGFDVDDIGVDGGEKGTFTGTDPGRIYTLVVTPTPGNNDGTDYRDGGGGCGNGPKQPTPAISMATPATQTYDTLATAPPIITGLDGDDNVITGSESASDVSVLGTNDADTTSVTLCANATDETDPTCTGGMMMYITTIDAATTTWRSTLTPDDIEALPKGIVTLTAIATDRADNTAVSESLNISIDASATADIEEPLTLPDDLLGYVTLPTLPVPARYLRVAVDPPATTVPSRAIGC